MAWLLIFFINILCESLWVKWIGLIVVEPVNPVHLPALLLIQKRQIMADKICGPDLALSGHMPYPPGLALLHGRALGLFGVVDDAARPSWEVHGHKGVLRHTPLHGQGAGVGRWWVRGGGQRGQRSNKPDTLTGAWQILSAEGPTSVNPQTLPLRRSRSPFWDFLPSLAHFTQFAMPLYLNSDYASRKSVHVICLNVCCCFFFNDNPPTSSFVCLYSLFLNAIFCIVGLL